MEEEEEEEEVRSAEEEEEGAIISAEVRAIFPSTEVMLWAAAFTRSSPSPSEAAFRAEPESPTDNTPTGQVRSGQVNDTLPYPTQSDLCL